MALSGGLAAAAGSAARPGYYTAARSQRARHSCTMGCRARAATLTTSTVIQVFVSNAHVCMTSAAPCTPLLGIHTGPKNEFRSTQNRTLTTGTVIQTFLSNGYVWVTSVWHCTPLPGAHTATKCSSRVLCAHYCTARSNSAMSKKNSVHTRNRQSPTCALELYKRVPDTSACAAP